MTPKDRTRDVVQGTLDMLVLKALSLTPMHGWGITNRINQITKGVLTVNPGSLYPALERLQDRGWITAAWETTESGRNAKFYKLTAAGRRRLGMETESWRRMAAAIEAVLRTTGSDEPRPPDPTPNAGVVPPFDGRTRNAQRACVPLRARKRGAYARGRECRRGASCRDSCLRRRGSCEGSLSRRSRDKTMEKFIRGLALGGCIPR